MPQPATVSHKSRLGQQQQHYQFFHSDLIMIVSKKTHDGTAKNAKTIMYCVRRHYLKRSSAYLGIFDDTKIFNKNKFKYLPTYIFLVSKIRKMYKPNFHPQIRKVCSNYEVAFRKCHPKDILLTIQIVKTCFIKYFSRLTTMNLQNIFVFGKSRENVRNMCRIHEFSKIFH